MEKRTVFAFLLLIGFFLVWSQFAPKKVPQTLEGQEVVSESVQTTPQEPQPKISEAGEKSLPAEGVALKEIKINNYYITYSPQGGYIQSIALNKPTNILPFQNLGYQSAKKDINYKVNVGQDSISFVEGSSPPKKYVFSEDTIKIENVAGSPILLFSFSLNSGTSHISKRYFESFYSKDKSIQRTHPKKVKQEVEKRVEFAGARSRYYAISLLPDLYNIEWSKTKERTNLYLNNPSSTILLYLGPQITDNMETYGLAGIVYYGFWHFLAVAIIKILYFFYSFLHNWGLSIIFLSFSTYAVLFPFTSKSTKAMKKMQEIQPLMQELKEKHKDNPQKMQKETVELYKKHKVNPLGGCLPLLFQFPIIIAFYQVVFRFSRLQGASFLWIQDLSLPDRLFHLPFTIPVVGVEYFNLLPILVMILGIVQQHITASSSNPQQKKIGLFMGVFIGIIFYKFPSALVLYWFVQNLLTLIYQVRLKKARTT
ncbi:MAG: membrane protein insertase YidC [Candidatus Omnitrophica bacterium]|nr:membrane protein insertase YidC [Candidatus Omnitrophota bacterium]MCF7893709.1 membrane protein insertase YidC [Candidatus Omnitrophota bacterium]